MHLKAVDLREFYHTTIGRVVRRVLRQKIASFWGEADHLRVIGLGHATPYLRPFAGKAERIVALMPSQQGAVYWPQDAKGLVALYDEDRLPIESNSVDRVLIVHTLNSPESLDAVLKEAWRVLTGQGRILLIVPNRAGIWARMDNTPFGHGTPYSMTQVRQTLKNYMFVPERVERALFFPPSTSRLLLLTAPLWEKIGARFFNAFGGVNLVEATKQIYAGTPVGVTSSALPVRRYLTAPKPAPRVGAHNKNM